MKTVGCHQVRPPGFEPGSPAWQTDVSNIDWEVYKDWLSKQFSERYARDVYSYSRKYADCLLKRDISKLLMIRKTKRTNIIKALSNLSKFLGVHDEFLHILHKHAMEWGGKSKDELVIERFTKVKDPDEIFKWIRKVKEVREDLADFMDLMAISGLRLTEAIESYNLIVKLGREGKLNEYYNEKRGTLEHFRFKEVFIRRSKKAFISFVPKDLINKIASNDPLPSTFAIQARVRKQGLPLRFSDIREAHASFMTKYLKQPEIDFIHGRVSTNIFMSNYFNPALISDLKERMFKAIVEIKERIA